jgi:hypothetical protein
MFSEELTSNPIKPSPYPIPSKKEYNTVRASVLATTIIVLVALLDLDSGNTVGFCGSSKASLIAFYF